MKIFEVIALLSCCVALLMQAFFVQKNEELRGPFDIRLDIAARMAFVYLALQALVCVVLVTAK